MADKVLLIDDDPELVDATTTLLEAKGYEVVTAADGTSGYEKAKECSPDIILLDVMMAHESEGFDVSRKMHKDETLKNIPVIIITGVREKMDLMYHFNPDEVWLPVKKVLEKPVKPEDLLSTIEKYLKAG
jgi:CheY-like chemotaxis protein